MVNTIAMPHRVANFLRTSSTPAIKTQQTRGNARHPSPYSSDADEDHFDQAVDLRKKNRLSIIPFVRSSSKDRTAPSSSPSLAIEWRIESPPIVFHGSPQNSTGALVSGQMFLNVKQDVIELDAFTAVLNLHVLQKRPFQNHCTDCQSQVSNLKSWTFAQKKTLTRGKHAFPFSVLLPGHLPATTDTPLVAIGYDFHADAVYISDSPNTTPLRFQRPFIVKRSQPEPDLPHHSIRVFPPTNIKASAHYMTVVHPIGINHVTLRLDGLHSHNTKGKVIDIWKLKRLTWRLEETIKTIAPACDKHAQNVSAVDSEAGRKGLPRKDLRVLGEKQIHDGWKSNYTNSDGSIEMEFDYAVNARRPHSKQPVGVACDTRSGDGTEVTHSLLLELVMSKEYAQEGKPSISAPTGTGRILRMHYAVTMTDHAGLGVSWDEETPPVYQDVPGAPPGYGGELGELIAYEELELLDAQRGSVSGSSVASESS